MIQKLFRVLLTALLLACISLVQAQTGSGGKMSFYAMDLGLDFRSANYATFPDTTAIKENKPDHYFSNFGIGVSGRIQTSVAALFQDPESKWLFGDIFAAEAGIGYLKSQFKNETDNLWLNYRFDLGAGIIHRYNAKTDFGLNLMLLEFARDNVAQTVSGSAVSLKYRYSKAIFELGIASTRDRFLGVMTALAAGDGIQLRVNGNYLISDKKTVGFRAEFLPDQLRGDFGSLYSSMWSVRVYYGIYF